MGGRGRGGDVERVRERRILIGWKEERRKVGLKGGREGEREAATCIYNKLFPFIFLPCRLMVSYLLWMLVLKRD